MVKEFYNKVIVTGGSGFLGKRLKILKPNWIYLSSKDVDLSSSTHFYEFLQDIKADAVINLAAKTGGIKHSVENQADFYYENSLISLNVVKQSQKANIKRLLSCLSTCCYPDVSKNYPMNEEEFLLGEPTQTNYGYALAKRELYRQTNFYRQFYGLNYSTFTPCNLYGPNANFGEDTSHFIASLIKKIHFSKDGETITLFGTGKPLRQHLYIDDLAKIVVMLLDSHNSDVPLNIAPQENLSIKDIANIALSVLNKNVKINFNNQFEGQFRKDVDNTKLLNLIGSFEWTPIHVGLKHTYDWFLENTK
jgi:GDP-L-fucose synthase